MATVVKVFAGEYDLTHQAQLRAEFDALYAENSLVLDMSAVTYLDSTFIGELIRLHNLRTAHGCNPPDDRAPRANRQAGSFASLHFYVLSRGRESR